MSSDTASKVQAGVYGNLDTTKRTGLLGLSPAATATLVPFVVVVFVCALFGYWAVSLLLLAIAIPATLLAVLTIKDGRSFYGRLTLKIMQRRKEKSGKAQYVSGPTGHTPDGKCRLPGLLAPSELSEHTDTYGKPFAVVRIATSKVAHYTVVIEAHPVGDELVDQSRVDSMVSHWASWLTQRGVDEGIKGASVTVESAPDSGLRLRRMVSENVVDTASAFGQSVAAAIPDEYRGGSPILRTWIAITFDGKAVDGTGRDRGLDEVSADIGNRLPVILAQLGETGAGTAVRALRAQDVTDLTRTAYDPTVAEQIEEARSNGGTQLRWEDAGPAFAFDGFDTYLHDRAASRSWTMYEGPRGMFYSHSLKRIVTPTDGVLRKRFTILYRPTPAEKTTQVIERAVNDANFSGSGQRRVTARVRQRQAAALKAEQEEAQGSGFTRFGVIVTVSVDRERTDLFAQLDRQIPAALNQARMRLRPALANQAVTFQAGLPLGLVLPAYTVLGDRGDLV